jgi:hypothetical protein
MGAKKMYQWSMPLEYKFFQSWDQLGPFPEDWNLKQEEDDLQQVIRRSIDDLTDE